MLANVLDEMLEGMQVIDRDWRYLYVNETVARQGKSARNALLGRTMMECYPGIDKTPLFEQLRKSMEQRLSIKMENEFEYPDGSTGWFQLYIHPVSEGLLILSADITSRKVAEALLRKKIDELDGVMQLASDNEVRVAEMRRMVTKLKDLAPTLAPKVELY